MTASPSLSPSFFLFLSISSFLSFSSAVPQVVHQERVTLESQLELLRPLTST